ncbi:hypothetical protein ACR6C2_34700 [Streptomyces sp. INA 01156]
MPRLCELLRGIDPRQEWADMSASALLTALVRLGDPAAVPTLEERPSCCPSKNTRSAGRVNRRG